MKYILSLAIVALFSQGQAFVLKPGDKDAQNLAEHSESLDSIKESETQLHITMETPDVFGRNMPKYQGLGTSVKNADYMKGEDEAENEMTVASLAEAEQENKKMQEEDKIKQAEETKKKMAQMKKKQEQEKNQMSMGSKLAEQKEKAETESMQKEIYDIRTE